MKRSLKHEVESYIAGRSAVALLVIAILLIAITVKGPNMLSLFAAATSSQANTTILYFTPSRTDSIELGQTFQVNVNINAHVPINAIGATITFPQDSLEVITISKENSFLDLWTEETAIREDSGEIHFSGGTLRRGGLTGVGTVLTITFRAKDSGKAQLRFSDTLVLASNGRGEPVEHERRTMTASLVTPPPPPLPYANISVRATSTLLTDFNSTGTISLLDVSLIAIRLIGPYEPKFDLNSDGVLNLGDLSAFFAMQQSPN